MNKATVTITGLDEAREDYNNWQGHAVIMIDKEDGKVWTDIFVSSEDWKKYRSKTIVRLYSKQGFYDRNDRISRATLNYLANFALNHTYCEYINEIESMHYLA